MMLLVALIKPFPTGVIAWISIGLICGLISGLSLKGNRLGVVGDLIFGLIGSLIASVPIGFLFRSMEGFGGSLVVAFAGACVMIVLSRVLFGVAVSR